MERIAVYPGTFDPITYGHLDVIERARRLFPRLVVAVAENLLKRPLFTLEERVELVKQVCSVYPDVEVEGFSCLLIDFVRQKQAKVIIRGLRAVSDFDFEFQLALTNRKMDNDLETIFMMPREAYIFLSSRMVKEICLLGGDISQFVPPVVQQALKEKLQNYRSRLLSWGQANLHL